MRGGGCGGREPKEELSGESGGGRQGELVNTSKLEGIKFRSYFSPLDFDPMVNIKSSSEMKPELALYIYSCMFPRKEALVKN